jgi:TrfA protein
MTIKNQSYGKLTEMVKTDDNKKLTVEERLERARNRRGTAQPEPAAAAAEQAPTRLPQWPDAVRAVPNGFLRSALFGAIAKGRRRYMERELVASVDGVEIRYTGQRLDQGDLDVWASILHAVRQQDLDSKCRVTSYSLLMMMGKKDTGGNRETLHARITRLRANAVEVKQGRYTYIGGLLAGAAKDEKTQEWVIEIDAKMCPLFADDQFTQIEWEIRQTLNGQQLSQWLHGFYASHAQPFPIKVETLLKLSGSENDNPRSAQQKLRKGLDAVIAASAAHGQLFSYEVRGGDLVYVEKKVSGPQRRHLAKKAATTTLRKPRA